MKKLFTLLFTAALATSLAAPLFAQDSASQSTETSKPAKTKKAKTHKSKKSKKEKKDKADCAGSSCYH